MRSRNAAVNVDVAVVGSGAGGGVVAAELAAAGLRIALFEEGPYVPSSHFTQRDGDMYPLLFRDEGLQSTDDASVLVLQGRCVGGSTVVNMGDVTAIPDELFAFWRQTFRLEGVTPEDLRSSIARVRERIGAGPIAVGEINAANRVLGEGAAKLGWRHGVFEDNRVNCVGSGYCQIGCSYDAKRSVLVTYVPRALEHGAEIYPRHRAERITHRMGRVTGLDAVRLDERGEPLGAVNVAAPNVFVCAGAVHTPLLLKRSGLGNRNVGRHLSLQPQAPVVARFDRSLRSFRGIPQSAFVDHFEEISPRRGFGGFRIEGIFGPPGTAAGFLPGNAGQLSAMLKRYDQFAAALVLVPDAPVGRVTPYGDQLYPRIEYTPTAAYFRTLKRGILAAADVYLAAGAVEIYLPADSWPPLRNAADLQRARDDWQLAPVAVRLVSAHPQGTARMSDSPRLGAVDSRFRLYGVHGLYVADASVFPTTSSSHTMLPIMSMADLAAQRFLADHPI